MKRIALTCALLLCVGTPAVATTLLWMDVADLTRNSTSIIRGTVTQLNVLSAQPGVPLTQVHVKIDTTLKGPLSGEAVISNPGFPGAPVFREGDEVVLFIHSRDGVHVLTGFQQGSFKVVTDEFGRKVLDRPIPSRNKAVQNGLATVEALVAEIKAAME